MSRFSKNDFKRNESDERRYSIKLQRKALEIARELSKAKNADEIDRIVKRYGKNPKYLKWAESVAKQMAEAQDFKSKQMWKMYFRKYRGKQARKLSSRLQKLIDTMKLDDIIKENEKLITSFPDVMGEKAKKKYRELVKANVTGGARASQISKYLREIGVSRADLIARTETGKAATAITERRSENLGLKGYIWKTSLDRRVRQSHRMMNNVICFWNDKPTPGIYEEPKNDRRVAPGEDYNCRCLATTIVEKSQITEIAKSGKVKVWKNNRIQTMSVNTVIKLLGVE